MLIALVAAGTAQRTLTDCICAPKPNDVMGRTVAGLLRLNLAPITAELRRRIPVQPRGPGE